MLVWVLGIAAFPSPVQGASDPPIPAHEAIYVVRYNGKIIGEIDFVLEPANEQVWHIRTQTRATSFLAKTLGSAITEAAHFVWQSTDDTFEILPLTYHQVSREPFRTRFWQHRFDWEDMRSETLTHEGSQVITLKENLMDPLTLRLALAARLMDTPQPSLSKDEPLRFLVLDRDDIEDQQMQYLGPETVDVPAGCFSTLHFYRFRKEGSSRNYDAWVSESNSWLPVKVRQQDGGRKITMELKHSDLLKSTEGCDQSLD